MFDRFIRLAKAQKALREGRLEAALQLAADPLIEVDRRAEQVRAAARDQLLIRGRAHLAARDLSAARQVVERLQALAAAPEVAELAAAIERAGLAEQEALTLARQELGTARAHLAKGDTAAASVVLAGIHSNHLLLERQQLLLQLAERRRRGEEHLEAAADRLRQGQVVLAIESFGQAVAAAADVAAASPLRPQVLTAAGQHAAERILGRLRAHEVDAALSAFRSAVADLPALASTPALAAVLAPLGEAVRLELRAATSIEAALPLARAVRAAGAPLVGPIADCCEALLAVDGPVVVEVAAAPQLAELAQALGAEGLAADARERLARVAGQQNQIAAARARLAAGQLDDARELLQQVLREHPLHEVARADLAVVDRGMAEQELRLQAARDLAGQGRLREACAVAAALAGAGRLGVLAERFVVDQQARMGVVDRGLDEVRVALHGRAAASLDGVRHCKLRLEELAKVQTDHPELPQLRAAVAAEIDGLERLERLDALLERGAVAEAAEQFGALLALRGSWLSPDRLDARLHRCLDQFGRHAELAVADGRLADAERIAALFGSCGGDLPEHLARRDRLLAVAAERRAAAETLAEQAREALRRGDLDEAERLLEQARQRWSDAGAVRLLLEELRNLRAQGEVLARVASLADGGDLAAAQRKLASLPPTPPMLRTRIYDMKQDLARAQGLDGAFLLRVDEGGEHLVVRGETVTIGNVRQARVDLPVLANIAGRHASLRRSMSFHGGMQDAIVAEEGEIRVGGQAVTRKVLAAGDRIQLGSALQLVYQQPCRRSLSAGLQVQGGFQIGGTDRLILMKDRGRDGRLLLGPGRDVHVRVGSAQAEVEVFSTPTGQMRVACEGGGTIDGVPFRGEHPVDAGQLVVAGGMSFVLLPFTATS